MVSVFDFDDYKAFLLKILGVSGTRTGKRSELAKHLNCQTAYISQVLTNKAEFSLEQAFKINSFLNHTLEESDFFLLLVQKARAGSKELQSYFQNHIQTILEKRKVIKNRVQTNKAISEQDQSTYYSHWSYLAVHMAVSVPHLRSLEALMSYLQLPRESVLKILDFLIRIGLVENNNNLYQMGPQHLHLGHDSENILKHHTNWRVQAIKALDQNKKSDLHYSVVYSLSKKDAEKIQQQIVELIRSNLEIVKPSKEEVLYCNTIDFFELKN